MDGDAATASTDDTEASDLGAKDIADDPMEEIMAEEQSTTETSPSQDKGADSGLCCERAGRPRPKVACRACEAIPRGGIGFARCCSFRRARWVTSRDSRAVLRY